MINLQIQHDHAAAAGIELITPRGEIDISNLQILDEVLDEAVGQQPRCLLIDLSHVEYMDSAAISSLLRAGRRLSHTGGELQLVDGNRFVRRLIQMTGIYHLFRHYDSVSAALAREGSSGSIDAGELDDEEASHEGMIAQGCRGPAADAYPASLPAL